MNDNIMDALNDVIGFSTELTMLELKGEKPDARKIEKIREKYQLLASYSELKYDPNWSDEEFLNQLKIWSNNLGA